MGLVGEAPKADGAIMCAVWKATPPATAPNRKSRFDIFLGALGDEFMDGPPGWLGTRLGDAEL